MLCFQAGKPESFDAFAVDQAIKTGHLAEQDVLQLVASRRFGAIEIDYYPTDPVRAVARHRFSAAFMTQLLANYRLAYRDNRYAVFIPRPS